MTTRNLLDCRANLSGCMGLVTFADSELVNGRVEDWVEVGPRDGGKPHEYHGVCPACIAASKPTSEKRKISGGTKFDPVELEAGGKVVVDRQKSLFE